MPNLITAPEYLLALHYEYTVEQQDRSLCLVSTNELRFDRLGYCEMRHVPHYTLAQAQRRAMELKQYVTDIMKEFGLNREAYHHFAHKMHGTHYREIEAQYKDHMDELEKLIDMYSERLNRRRDVIDSSIFRWDDALKWSHKGTETKD